MKIYSGAAAAAAAEKMWFSLLLLSFRAGQTFLYYASKAQ